MRCEDLDRLLGYDFILNKPKDEARYKRYCAKRIFEFIETTVNIGAPKGMITVNINGKQVSLVVHVKEIK